MSRILTLNAGSSSVKFALFTDGAAPERVLHGQIDGFGDAAQLIVDGEARAIGHCGPDHALPVIFAAIGPHLHDQVVAAIGHRIVHGGADYRAPTELTPDVMARLEALSPLAPLHQPYNLTTVRASMAAFPGAAQIGCFDTSFHRQMPWRAETYALPRSYFDEGVRRYGFHGLSYDHVSTILERDHPDLWKGKVVIAHLGSGASMCALDCGRSVATTMGFSALDGLPMGTRSGQLDPAVVLYMLDQKGMSAAEVGRVLYRESGLKGLSGLSNDMRVLEQSDAPEAAAAIAYFTYRCQCEIGSLAAAMQGLDGMVFTAGIGEHSARIRRDVVAGLGWLGFALDDSANAAHARKISTSQNPVLVIPTDEEEVIARASARVLPRKD